METPPSIKSRKISLPKRTTVSVQGNDNEDSPTYIPNTQESLEGIDVVWDWNSPQSTQRKHKKIKKCLIQSPQASIKRCLSITQQQQQQQQQNTQLEKLHDELKALQKQLAQPDDEDCLCVSPQQEREFKSIVLDNDNDQIFTEFDDIFNDSVDEQLLLCSQKVEHNVIDDQQKADLWNNNLIKTGFNDDDDDDNKWDDVFNSIENEKWTKQNKQIKTLQQRTKSEEKFIQTTTGGTVGFQRTKSHEIPTVIQQQTTTASTPFSKAMLDEIERKRCEAKWKLEAKRKQESNKRISPNQCTNEEIEKKRQEAKAKLEAKRMQDLVERNRQEAIKRLQMNRQKNATQLKRL